MQYRRRRGGSSQHKGLNKPPRRYKDSVGLASDKAPGRLDPRELHRPGPQRRGACLPPCSRPVVASPPPPLPRWGSCPSSGGCSSSPRSSSPRTRSTCLSHFFPLPAHCRRAAVLACRVVSSPVSVDLARPPRSPRENVGWGLPGASISRWIV